MNLQDLSLLMIASCILLLALINMYLVWRLIKGVRFEDERLDVMQASSQQILSQQLTVKHIVSDPAFLALMQSLAGGRVAATPVAPALAAPQAEGDDAPDPAFMAGLETLGQTADQFGELFTSLNDSTDVASWKAANQARISELLRAQTGMRAQVEQLQSLLTKSNATILNLRAKTLNPNNSSADDHKAELNELRRTTTRLTNELNAVAQEGDQLRAALAARDTKLAAAEAVLKNEKVKFEEEKKRLLDKQAEMQSAMDRTLVEKSFIEEAFIEEAAAHDKPAA